MRVLSAWNTMVHQGMAELPPQQLHIMHHSHSVAAHMLQS